MERLSTLDLSNLRVEDCGLPMHVAALAILDGAAPGAGLDLDTVRTVIGQRLHLAPRLRQVLYWPRRGLGRRPGRILPGLISAIMCARSRCPRRETRRCCCRSAPS